ncbi:hypothetical protein [Flavobacterium sp.]|uniref:hypothetical protein n=1 Tax=Flavobacterium sp. TaxID=239 RepID=UPI00286AFA36|nr:hypothetical protein [Flavobacterium sp.]
MKPILFLIFILSVATNGFGQNEFSKKFKAIPPIDIKVNPPKETKKDSLSRIDLPKIITPNVFDNSKTKPNNSFQMGVKNDFSLAPKNKFINPGDAIVQKLNKKPESEDGFVYRKNQNLGNFKTKSTTAKILYRDFGEVDGDFIQVYLNDSIIIPEIIMDSEFQSFEVTLEKGFNKIDFKALNQGSSGPNTAEFQVYDEKGILISANQWNLATGFKATIILTKE